MGFDQYHEPPEELSQETRTLARMFASLTEEAEAINWYEQRLAVEQDAEAREIITDARHEEYKHFAMDLEPQQPGLVEQQVPPNQRVHVQPRPALELELDDAERVQRLRHVRGERVRRRVGRAGERGDDHQPAREPQSPWTDERQGAEPDEQDQDPGREAGPAHRGGVRERSGQACRSAGRLIEAHAQRICDRPRRRGVGRPLQGTRCGR